MFAEFFSRGSVYGDQVREKKVKECIGNGIDSKECFSAFYGKYRFDFSQ